MAMKAARSPKTFAIRPTVQGKWMDGRGVKVTKNNVSLLTLWAKDAKAEAIYDSKRDKDGSLVITDRVKLHTVDGVRVARLGDVIVKLLDKRFVVIKADEYEKFISLSF